MLQRIKDALRVLFPPKGFIFTGFVTPQEQEESGTTTTYKGNFIPGTDAIGDGRAEFLADMTEDEYLDHVKDESGFWKKWRNKFGL